MKFDHQQAVRTHAVERYLLDELPSPLREEFEDHFFTCPQCAEALRTGTMLRDNVRALLRVRPQSSAAAPMAASPEAPSNELQHVVRRSRLPEDFPLGWRTWFRASTLVPWAAALLFLAVAVWQQRTGLGGQYPAAVSASYVALHADTRGLSGDSSAGAGPSVRSTGLLSLAVDVPSNGTYHWSLRREKDLATAPAIHSGVADARDGLLAIVMDTRRLEAGGYILVTRSAGGSATQPSDHHFPFVLKAEQQ
jgi:anti-sigma factor RsiW